MPMYKATVRDPQGEKKDRVWARDLNEVCMLLEQRHVPFIPHVVPS